MPRTLLEAIEAFAADPFSQEVMGPELARAITASKTADWWRYHNTISQREYNEYLEKF